MTFKGKVWKYGDDVNTDQIIPGKYIYITTDPLELAKHALEDLDATFVKNVKEGDIIVGGKNFGCGSSREAAAICIKYAGVSAVVAKTFARIFFRNAINYGLPAIQCEEAVDKIANGEEISIDFERGKLYCNAGEFTFPPLPESILGIFKDGGLVAHVKKIASQ